MTRVGVPDPWRRFAPPRASKALGERVLAASRSVAAACPVATRADRIWFSSRWRLAWVAALTGLAGLELVAGRASATGRALSPVPHALVREADHVAVALGLAPGGWLGAREASGEARADLTMKDLP